MTESVLSDVAHRYRVGEEIVFCLGGATEVACVEERVPLPDWTIGVVEERIDVDGDAAYRVSFRHAGATYCCHVGECAVDGLA